MDQELISFLIDNGAKEVLTQEPTPGNLSRPLTVRYTLDAQVLIETITYSNPTNSAGWAEEARREYSLQTTEGFNTIEL